MEGPGVLLERNQKESSRCDFEGGWGGRRNHMGGRRKSNAAVTTDGSRVKNVTLGTDTNAPLTYAPGL